MTVTSLKEVRIGNQKPASGGQGQLDRRILLESKVRIPPRPDNLISRRAVVDRLEQASSAIRLITLVAPAGYGKTTVLGEWARSSERVFVWVSLGPGDDDPEGFLRYLYKAWLRRWPALERQPLGRLLDGHSPPIEDLLAAFVQAAGQKKQPLVFVVDNYQYIQTQAVHDALAILIENSPTQVLLALAGRSEPSLPLARYRVGQQLLELDRDDLGFSAEQSRQFLTESMGARLDERQMDRLHSHLEGWPAGLGLAALAIGRQSPIPEDFSISGDHRYIADYLSEEVLSGLPQPTRDFLLKTSILDSLSGDLCDAVTQNSGSQAILENFDRDQLFLQPLDPQRRWFRYHTALVDFLRNRLQREQPGKVSELHRRAAAWFAERDQADLALQHALAAGDIDQTVSILERHFVVKLLRGEIATAARWLQSVPPGWVLERPALQIAQASLHFIQGDFESGARWLALVSQHLETDRADEHNMRLRGQMTSLQCASACMQGDLDAAERFAEQSLASLTATDFSFRVSVHLALGDSYRRFGQWQKAKRSYQQALDLALRDPLFAFSRVHGFGALADLALRKGLLRQAADDWDKAMQAIEQPENWGSLPLPLSGWVYVRQAEISYEWNQLDVARRQLTEGLERGKLGEDARTQLAGNLLGARLDLAEGLIEPARERLEAARPWVEQTPYSDWTARFQRTQVELWLAEDKPRVAALWAEEMLKSGELNERPDSEQAQLAVAHALLAGQDRRRLSELKALLRTLIRDAEKQEQIGVQIEAALMLALVEWSLGDKPTAMTVIEPALSLAQTQGYLRAFLDLGLPCARLLQEARARHVLPDYVEDLLQAFEHGGTIGASSKDGLPEPLTPREQDVLHLIMAGLTNPEIADQLTISSETVKKHARNIYAKLGVKNRTEAAAKARQLKLTS